MHLLSREKEGDPNSLYYFKYWIYGWYTKVLMGTQWQGNVIDGSILRSDNLFSQTNDHFSISALFRSNWKKHMTWSTMIKALN